MTTPRISSRLAAVVDALPLRPGVRVLEIGGAPGVVAREVTRRHPDAVVLVVDRSERGVAATRRACADDIVAGRIGVLHASVEDLSLPDGEPPYDLALAVRVGALDGRHPEAGRAALPRIADCLTPAGRLLIDGGDPLREVPLPRSHPDDPT